MIKKIKSKDGSAMTVAIIAMVLVGIFSSIMTSMLTNQIRLSMKNSKNTNLKYEAEAGIEETIGKFIEDITFPQNIGASVPIQLQNEFEILPLYIELVDIIIHGDGLNDTVVNTHIGQIKDRTITKDEMQKLANRLNVIIQGIKNNTSSTSGKNGDKHKDVIDLLSMAQLYAQFFADNFFEENSDNLGLNMNYKLAISFINQMLNNLKGKNFGSETNSYGNVGRAYRDLNVDVKYLKRLKDTYETFKDKVNYIGLTGDESENIIDLWVSNNISNISKTITDSGYNQEIITNKDNIWNKWLSYLDDDIRELYCKHNDECKIDYKLLVDKRLDIVKKEIDMVLQWLKHMEAIKKSNDSNKITTIYIPKSIQGLKNYQIINNTITTNNVTKLSDEGNNHVFKVDVAGSETKIGFKLRVQSEVIDNENGNYKIEANIKVEIKNIMDANRYDIDYEIESWNKI